MILKKLHSRHFLRSLAGLGLCLILVLFGMANEGATRIRTGPLVCIDGQEGDQNHPQVAVDPVNHRFLVTWKEGTGTSDDLYGRVVAHNGSQGPIFRIAEAVTYQHCSGPFDPQSQLYLVLWVWANQGTFGQLRHADGSPAGDPFLITEEGFALGAAFDPGTRCYLVIWQNWDALNYSNIKGRFVSHEGEPQGEEILITNHPPEDPHQKNGPRIAFDPKNRRFLVTWAEDYSKILGQLINPDGSFFGEKITFGTYVSTSYVSSLVCDPIGGRFLVLWDWVASRFLSGNGELAPQTLEFTPDPVVFRGDSYSAVFDPERKLFLLVFGAAPPTSSDLDGLWGRYFHPDGQSAGPAFRIYSFAEFADRLGSGGVGWGVAAGPAPGGALVVWSELVYTSMDIWGKFFKWQANPSPVFSLLLE